MYFHNIERLCKRAAKAQIRLRMRSLIWAFVARISDESSHTLNSDIGTPYRITFEHARAVLAEG